MDIDEIRRANIRSLEKECGGMSALANRLKMDYTQCLNYRSGVPDSKTGKVRGMRKETAWRFEDACGKPRGWLDQYHGTEDAASTVSSDEVLIPRLFVSGSMGGGSDYPEHDEVIEKMTLRGDWLRQVVPKSSIGDLRIISGKGHSMAPTFNDGDLMLVDTGVRAVDVDGVYVLSANGRLYIKTVRQRIDGHFEVSSDNPAVKTVDVLNGDYEVAIHGRVVWAWNGRKL